MLILKVEYYFTLCIYLFNTCCNGEESREGVGKNDPTHNTCRSKDIYSIEHRKKEIDPFST